MARSTRLVTQIKNIYSLDGRERSFLPVNTLFTLRATGLKIWLPAEFLFDIFYTASKM